MMRLQILLSIALFLPMTAFGVTNLKQVQVTKNGQVDLLFDQKVDENQVKVEFFRDIIQLSIKDVSVYPAKIFTVQGSPLKKVFSYQYTPNLIRTRLTIDGKADDFKQNVKVSYKNRIMTINVADPEQEKDTIKISSAAQKQVKKEEPIKSEPIEAETAKASEAKEAVVATSRDKQILNKIANNKDPKEKKTPLKSSVKSKDVQLTGGKELPSPIRSFAWLSVILGLFGVVIFFFAKVKSKKGVTGALKKAGFGNLLRGKMGKNDLIDLVASYNLGAKKSIAIVKVANQLLVLGITDDAINLITQMDRDEFKETTPEELKKSIFAEMLSSESKKTNEPGPTFTNTPPQGATAASTASTAKVTTIKSDLRKATQEQSMSVSREKNSVILERIKRRVENLKEL